MTEQEYRERAARGEYLTEEERLLLTNAETLLYPVAKNHWDLAACFCPLCLAWRALVQAENKP